MNFRRHSILVVFAMLSVTSLKAETATMQCLATYSACIRTGIQSNTNNVQMCEGQLLTCAQTASQYESQAVVVIGEDPAPPLPTEPTQLPAEVTPVYAVPVISIPSRAYIRELKQERREGLRELRQSQRAYRQEVRQEQRQERRDARR